MYLRVLIILIYYTIISVHEAIYAYFVCTLEILYNLMLISPQFLRGKA